MQHDILSVKHAYVSVGEAAWCNQLLLDAGGDAGGGKGDECVVDGRQCPVPCSAGWSGLLWLLHYSLHHPRDGAAHPGAQAAAAGLPRQIGVLPALIHICAIVSRLQCVCKHALS